MIIYSKEIAAKIYEETDPSLFGTEIHYYADAGTGAYKLQLKNLDGAVLSEVDCTDFIKDGMVESVEVQGSDLVITFNTDSGKQAITLDLSHVFDASDYYTKAQTEGKISDAINALSLGTASTHDVTDDMNSELGNDSLPTKGAVKSYIDTDIAYVQSQIKDSTITIANGYPSDKSSTFTLNQGEGKTIDLGLNASAYRAVADTIPGEDTNALPTVSAVTSYISGLGYATVAQLPTVNDATISIKRNANDDNPALFTLNQADNEAVNLNLGSASEHGVDTSIGSEASNNLPTSDAVKSYVTGMGYVQGANLGAAAYKGVDSSIPAESSSNVPSSDAVKEYAYSKAEVDNYIANVVYNEETRTFTFTRGDGSTFTVAIS